MCLTFFAFLGGDMGILRSFVICQMENDLPPCICVFQ